MVRNTATLALVLVGLMAVSGHHRSEEYWKDFAARTKVAQSINEFSQDVYGNVYEEYKDKKENAVYFAANDYDLYKQLSLGAAEKTKQEFYKKLYYNGTEFENAGYASLYQFFYSFNEFDFYAKNKIFYPRSVTIKQSYLDALKKFYQAEPFAVDFAKFDEAYKAINEWASKASNSHINNFISENNSNKFDEKTSLFLASTFYFKPKFLYPVDSSLTTLRPFTDVNGKTENVPTLKLKGVFKFGVSKDLDFKWVEIPLASNEFSHEVYLYIFNYKNFTMKGFEDKRKQGFLRDGEFRNGNVYFPKSLIESSGDVKKYYPNFEIFGDNADFSKLSNDKLKISHVVRKNVIEFDETSNAEQPHGHAADAGVHAVNSNHDIDYYVDNPFYFAAYSSNVLLFAGQYVKSSYKN